MKNRRDRRRDRRRKAREQEDRRAATPAKADVTPQRTGFGVIRIPPNTTIKNWYPS